MSADAKAKIAVAAALEFDPHSMRAPQISALARGSVAEKILQTARRYGVPIKTVPSLAERLGELEVLQEIPVDLYDPVAEILAGTIDHSAACTVRRKRLP